MPGTQELRNHLLVEIDFSFTRSSGPGGQNVNKVNSKCVMKWSLFQSLLLAPDHKTRFYDRYKNRISNEGVFILTSDQYRDQKQNKEHCITTLLEMILGCKDAPKKRKKTKPSYSSREKLKTSKRAHSSKKTMRKVNKKDW